MIELKEVSCSFSDGFGGKGLFTAVSPLNAHFSDGGRYAIVGESGSGKTTLARMIAGLQRPSGGSVFVDGAPVYGRKRAGKEHFRKVQIIQQNSASALDPKIPVGKSIEEPLHCFFHMEKEKRRERCRNLMELCNLSRDYYTRLPSELSGGEQKRVAIARALAVEPQCLIFDEATNGFDLPLRKKIIDEIIDLQQQLGFTLIFITHDMELAVVVADEIFVMRNSNLVERAAFSGDYSVFHDPYSRMLLEASGLVDTSTEWNDKTKERIKSYRKFALAYTMSCKKGMVAFNSVINSSFLVLVPTALIIGFVSNDLIGFMQSFLFYVIFSPACAVMLNKIMYMTSYKMQAEESMRRIDMILTAEPQAETSAPKHPKTYDVSFENVTFAYENTDHPAVSHLSFTAKAGTTTALVGHSGSGKSTTASLIPRFYDVQQGAVKIGGVDIREIPHADLMKMVAFVFQDPKLFKDTLLENIRAGRPSATREEVLQAAHLAQCDDILEKFPDGLDTVVGSKGVYLSGGETQRIAIARAILKDAPIVVLDEATAYADPENEQQIQKAFEGLVKGKTVIMIAHRLSTIQDADLILVMKQGELVESGTHDALVKQGGEYAKMWSNYTKTTKWHIGNEVKVC